MCWLTLKLSCHIPCTLYQALNERKAEIRIQLRSTPHFIFGGNDPDAMRNELVIRLQPSEAIYMKCVSWRGGVMQPAGMCMVVATSACNEHHAACGFQRSRCCFTANPSLCPRCIMKKPGLGFDNIIAELDLVSVLGRLQCALT